MARLTLIAQPEKGLGLRLYLRASVGPARRYVALGVPVKPRDWNAERAEVRRSHPEAEVLNRRLAGVKADAARGLAEIEADAHEHGRPVAIEDVERLARAIARPGQRAGAPRAEGVIGFIERWAAESRAADRIGTAGRVGTVAHKLRAHLRLPTGDVPFDRVDVRFVRDFEHYLRATLKNGPNTVEKNLSTLRTALREAIRQGLMEQAAYPFFHVRLKQERVKRPNLTTAEVDRLAALEIGEAAGGGRGSAGPAWLRLSRDLWLFAFYAGGMRFGDVAVLRRRDVAMDAQGVRRLRYAMRKTGEAGSLVLIPEALAILARYEERAALGPDATVFPVLDGYDLTTEAARFRAIGTRNAYVNRALKRLAELAGIEKRLTFHLARHSLARYLLDKGFDLYAISSVLRHQNVRITQAYLAGLDTDKLDATYAAAFASRG